TGLIGAITEPDGTVHDGPGEFGPASEDGIWEIRLPGAGSNVGYDWTVDVVSADGVEIPGRVWTARDGLRQSSAQGTQLRYWIVNDTGYVYSVAIDGYYGGNSYFQANSVGWADADCVPTYASYEYALDGVGGGAPGLPDCG